MTEIKLEGERVCCRRERTPTAAAAMNSGEKLAGGARLGPTDHHRAKRWHGEREEMTANSPRWNTKAGTDDDARRLRRTDGGSRA